MNPWVVKIGIGIAVATAAYLFTLWSTQKNARERSYTNRNSGKYDGSNMKICCICLKEFKFFEKSEVISLPCNHKLCRVCCKTMFSFQVKNNRNCPHCRQLVPEEFLRLFKL